MVASRSIEPAQDYVFAATGRLLFAPSFVLDTETGEVVAALD